MGDAVEALDGSDFDVVLLDLHLPDGSGAECVEQMQQTDSRLPIVVLSGQGDEDFAVEILSRGAQDYIVKWEGDGRTILRAVRYAIERKKSEVELNYLARYDSLTGIPNRQYLRDQLDRATQRAHRRGKKVGLVFLDLDRFKAVNDTCGHQLGDALLRAVVQRLLDNVRAGDLLARLGGDEFAVVVEDVRGPLELESVAAKLVDAFNEPFRVEDRQFFITASLGLTVFPYDNKDPAALLNNADIAMYQAKESGRNNFKFFTRSMHDEILRYHATEADLKTALTDNQFELVYQPQVRLADRGVEAVEALLRWQHPERGYVTPDEFISVAEESGYIIPIGLWVLEEVCRQIKEWERAGLSSPRMAVNIAAMHFQQPGFAAEVERVLERYAVDPGLIELELTEHSLMQDTDSVRNCLRELKATGVKLAIDDFGTGYSCLNYLRQFPIDVLKIDKSFVADLGANAHGRALCEVILSIAQRLSLATVAEGIEEQRQLEFLTAHGCEYGQGFYISRPVGPEHVRELVARESSDAGAAWSRARSVEATYG